MVKKLLIIFAVLLIISGIGAGIYFSLTKLKNSGVFDSNEALAEFFYGFEKEGQVFDNDQIANLEVIELSDGRFRMFFHNASAIQSAISEDGKVFTPEQGNRLTGQMPATIELPDGKFRMYFVSEKNLKSAISEDGFKFTVENGDRLTPGAQGTKDSFGIIHPSIVKLPDGGYKLFYDGVSSTEPGPSHWHIMSASSDDGLTWKKDEGVRIPHPGPDEDNENFPVGDFYQNSAFSPFVELKNNIYEMYFTSEVNPQSGSGIWLATSPDGLKFTIKEKPVISRQKEYGDDQDNAPQGSPRGVAQDPFILKTNEGDRLFYWVVEQGIFSALRKN